MLSLWLGLSAPVTCAAFHPINNRICRSDLSHVSATSAKDLSLVYSSRSGSAIHAQYGYDDDRSYGRQEYSRAQGDYAEVDVATVEDLIKQRAELRMQRDFDGADAIRDELKFQMGVVVSDRDMTWSASGGGNRRSYNGDNGRERNYGQQRHDGSGEYERDPRDTAEIDVAHVEALIAERTALRRERDFNGADAIRDELKMLGVAVFDRDLTWRVETGSNRRNGRQPRDSYSRDSYSNRAYREDPYTGGGRPQGPYEYVGEVEAGVDEAYVQALITERNDYRSTREYNEADAIRAKLTDIGVWVDDRMRQWGMGAVAGGRAAKQRPVAEFGALGHDYSRSTDDTVELDAEFLEKVNELLRKRLESKLSRDFDRADALLDEIKEMGVEVNDGRKAWRADGGGFKPRAYKRIGNDPSLDEPRVLQLLSERADARKVRDYETADAIAAELSEMGVSIDDAKRTWSVKSIGGGYTRIGSPVPQELEDKVMELLTQRDEFKSKRDYDAADEIQNILRNDMGVFLDNRKRTWKINE